MKIIHFQVSVIIPVYNAARYVGQAVQSALIQPSVHEIILVEDGSGDDSLILCQQLAGKYDRVHLFQHPGGVNCGAASSRSLGMKCATCDYIAFLDADDFFLPERFSTAENIFTQHPDCDGVYEAVGIHFEDEQAKTRWLASSMARKRDTTLTEKIPPENLFEDLIKGWKGSIHLNGLVIKQAILKQSGFFNHKLGSMHEDTDFILRLAAVGRLLPGNLSDPVAIRRVHTDNRISAPRSSAIIFDDKMRLSKETYRWCKRKGLKEKSALVFKRMVWECAHQKPLRWAALNRLPHSSLKAVRLLSWPCEVPEVVLEPLYWRELGSALWGILRNDLLKLEDRL